jgi:A/G-specific adenine glycosylase
VLRGWLRRRLLAWFREHQRDLPWRANRDPYPIWVSEIMLQQTLVATVVSYFPRFLQAFPTIADLAQAEEQQVLRLWEGLGYYRRARYLHQAARQIMHEHGGSFPQDPQAVARLPGFGRYTVGAVLSQAFDQRLPILEANSIRVLCRLFALEGNPKAEPLHGQLWDIAQQLLPRRNVGDFNQALMELGALICTPAAPRCGQCPLHKHCAAFQQNRQEQLPTRTPPPAIIQQQEVAVVVRRQSEVLIVQRPDQVRWANLWEFPHELLRPGETHEQAAQRLISELTGLQARPGSELTTIRHGVTRYQITLVCLEAVYLSGDFRSVFYPKGVWVSPEHLHNYPFSSPQRKLAKLLTQPHEKRLF